MNLNLRNNPKTEILSYLVPAFLECARIDGRHPDIEPACDLALEAAHDTGHRAQPQLPLGRRRVLVAQPLQREDLGQLQTRRALLLGLGW